MTAASLPTNIVAPASRRRQVTVAIIPKPHLSPADCQRLAYRLSMALRELGAAEDRTGNTSAIDDLLSGELPKPIVMRAMSLYRALTGKLKRPRATVELSEVITESRKRLSDNPLVDLIDVPAVFINLTCDEGDEAVESRVHAMLPAELISKVQAISKGN